MQTEYARKCFCDDKKPYIFVSYAHKDAHTVLGIIDRLVRSGYNVWWDEGIDPGTEWDENIAEHVMECSYFVAFISKNFIDSKNCKDELNYSRDLDKNQLLVYLENVELPRGMAMRMNRIQSIFWCNYRNPEDAYAKLDAAKGIEVAKLPDEAPAPADQKPAEVQVRSEVKAEQDGSTIREAEQAGNETLMPPSSDAYPTYKRDLILSIIQVPLLPLYGFLPLILTLRANSFWKCGDNEAYEKRVKAVSISQIIGWIFLGIEIFSIIYNYSLRG